MTDSKIRVTTTDTETGETNSAFVPEDSFIVICAGRCYVAHRSIYANGTTQLTLKVDQ